MTSMNHPTPGHVALKPRLVLLAAEPTKDIHHSALAGIFKGAQGDVLGLGQQGFGFSHLGVPSWYANSLNKTALSGIHFHFKGVKAA